MIFLDTNAAIYLFSGYEHFPMKTQKAIEADECYVSPMVRLELQYLFEIGRTKHKSQTVIDTLYKDLGVLVHNHYFDPIVLDAISAPWSRHPFDRIITAHAKCMEAILVTTDKIILKNYPKAIWA